MKRWSKQAAAILAAVLGLNLALAGPAPADAASYSRPPSVDVQLVEGDYEATAWSAVGWEILWRHRGPILKCGFPLGRAQQLAVRAAVRRMIAATRVARAASGVCATTWQIARAVAAVVEIGLLRGEPFSVSDETRKLTRPYLLPNRCDITIDVGRSGSDTRRYAGHYYVC